MVLFNSQRLVTRKESSAATSVLKNNPAYQMRERIVKRAALEFKDGMYGNRAKSRRVVGIRLNEFFYS